LFFILTCKKSCGSAKASTYLRYNVYNMTKFWINIESHALTIGESEAAIQMERCGAALIPLVDFVERPDFSAETRPDTVGVSEWTPTDYVQHGHWIKALAEDRRGSSGPTQPLLSNLEGTLDRLHTLGLGPSDYRVRRRFRTMPLYREACGLPATNHLNKRQTRFSSWSTSNFVEYARELQRSLDGRLPERPDYAAAAKGGRGPSPTLIGTRVGGLGILRELLGYPNAARNWDREDYLDWGVRVMEANQRVGFIALLSVVLSKRRQGPSDRTIATHFGGWEMFRLEVLQEQAARQQQRAEKIAGYRSQIAEEKLPPHYAKLTDDKLIAAGARFHLAQRLTRLPLKSLPGIPRDADEFITLLTSLNPSLTPGKIESEAVLLDVFDDIWPMSNISVGFKVSGKELERERSAKRRGLRQLRRRRGVPRLDPQVALKRASKSRA
jgi:hypothetical protein